MKVTSEQRPPREAVVSVELDAADVEPYLERAYKQVVSRLNIAGFRKGKAPRRIVEQMYGREYLANEALDFMLPELTTKALEQESLEMAAFPSISLEQLDPIKYTATVPLTPVVDLGSFSKLRVPRERVRITKSQIDEVLSQIANETAPWEPVDGAPQYEDLLNLDVHGWVYHEEHEHDHDLIKSEATDHVPREGSRTPVPGFAAELLKLPMGEEASFDLEIPSDFENTEIAGQTAHFVATLHSVKRRLPVAVDDEMAKGVGEGFENIAALRDRVKQDLEAQETQNVEARHKEEALTKLIEGATMEVSPIIVDHELDHYLEDFREAMETGRMTIEHYQRYLTWAGKSQEEIRDDARPTAEEREKRGLVLQEFIKHHAIEVTEDQVKDEIEKMVSDSGPEAKQIRDMFKEQGSKESLRRVMTERKAVDAIAELALGGADAAADAGEESKPKKAPKGAAKPSGASRAKAKPKAK